MVKIVATTLLPVDRLMATDCNAAAFARGEGFWYWNADAHGPK